MKQIPKREGAVLNGYGLSVLSLALLLFLLPFASTLVISLGENLGTQQESSIHDTTYFDANAHQGLPKSFSWISSGSHEDSACDEGLSAIVPTYPFENGIPHTSPDLCELPTRIHPTSPYLGSGYSYFNGCATDSNSSVDCGNDDFKMRVNDPLFDWSDKVFNQLNFELLGIPDATHSCEHSSVQSISGNVSLKYKISVEVWETERALPVPTLPQYYQKIEHYDSIFTGKHEFNSCQNWYKIGGSSPYFSINHTLDFIDSNEYLKILEVFDRVDYDVAGERKNYTLGFIYEWYDVRDEDVNAPISNSQIKLPYNELNSVISMYGDLDLIYFEAEYWNTATNSLTIILGVVFALTAFASTPYFNPTKSRIIDRLRDA